MPTRNRNEIPGDLYVSGTIHAAGINSADTSKVITKVASTEESVRQVELELSDTTADVAALGASEVFETRYIRSVAAPATPTGDDPAGWYTDVPTGSDPIWMSGAQRSLLTHLVIGTWYMPVRFTGAATVVGVLTNDLHHVPCDVDGNNPNFNGAVTRLIVYEGSEDTTAEFTPGRVDGTGITSTIDAAGVVTVTAMTVDVAYITLARTRSGDVVTKDFKVVKIREGASTPAYRMSVDTTVVLVKPDGTRNPTTVNFAAFTQTGLSEPQVYAGVWKFYVNGVLQLTVPAATTYAWSGFGDILLSASETYTDFVYDPTTAGAFLLSDANEWMLPFEYEGTDPLAYMSCELYDTSGTVMLDSQSIVFIADWENYREDMLGEVPDYAPRYLGRFETVALAGTVRKGDWFTVWGNSPDARGIYYHNGTAAARIDGTLDGQQALIAAALPDVLWATKNGHGTTNDYGAVTYIQYLVSDAAFIQALQADVITAGEITIGPANVDTALQAELDDKRSSSWVPNWTSDVTGKPGFKGNLSGHPATPVKGDWYFNTGDGKQYEYDGAAWQSTNVPTASQVGADASGTAAGLVPRFRGSLATPPGTGNREGDTYFDTATKKVMAYKDAAWVDATLAMTAAGVGAATEAYAQAQAAAADLAAKNALAYKLGFGTTIGNAWAALEAAARAGTTIIDGGYINTDLIDAGAITADMIDAASLKASAGFFDSIESDSATFTNCEVTGNFDGNVSVADLAFKVTAGSNYVGVMDPMEVSSILSETFTETRYRFLYCSGTVKAVFSLKTDTVYPAEGKVEHRRGGSLIASSETFSTYYYTSYQLFTHNFSNVQYGDSIIVLIRRTYSVGTAQNHGLNISVSQSAPIYALCVGPIAMLT